ncbi:MAG: hypothetical protein AUJ72_00735 [Candidatus Omnitrophica bacterium CG1_02_46_14]|nr:MAG: hypothetical protein AUJ72_00735 [Candidatus Omnitrophica bacterium CG1_02_46_14]
MVISAVIIALNEEKNIVDCLRSLAFCDERIVVDGGSRDRTVEIARISGGKVHEKAFEDFSSQKNFAVEKAASEWIFSIDADERVSPELADEIKRAVTDSVDCAAYAVKRRTKLFGRFFKYSGLQDDRPIRLFRKGFARFEQPVHEKLRVNGKIGRLKGTLEHMSFQTLSEYLKRLQLYTSLETGGPLNSKPSFFMRPSYRFLLLYVVKQGFRDGVEGFIYCALSGYYEFIRWAKLWEKGRLKADD